MSALFSSMNLGNWLVSLLFMFFCGVLLVSTSGYVSKLYLRYTISSDAKNMLQQYRKQVDSFDGKLEMLSKLFLFDCMALDRHQLKHITYNDYALRRLSLHNLDGSRCSSFEGASGEDTLAPLIHALSARSSLWVTSGSRNEQNLLVAQWKGEKGSLYVHMEPIVTEAIRHKYCENCVLTAISAANNPTISFWRGDAALFSQPILFNTRLDNGISIRVYVSDELLSIYHNKTILPLLLLGIGLGFIVLVVLRFFEYRKMSLHALVEQGILQREFIPYYQPIVDVSTNSLYGCEMLARWKRHGQGLISPMEFIPYVEKSGQILPITEQLIEKAIGDVSKLNWGNTHQVISVNIVPDQLEQVEVLANSLAVLDESPLLSSQLAFEVTERKRFTNLAMASQVIETLRTQGIDVKLDDAGTGYGGFSYIQQLDIRSLKIDKMFVETIGTADLKLSLLDSIIAFGREAKMEMIAEGVETEEQSIYLAKHGVTLQQGFYFGRPMPFRDFAYYCKSMVARQSLTKRFQIPPTVLYNTNLAD
ncbi:EAL domain-containing protein [Photobacterium swingsii]|uniref:EAL domain-containing protein n=2 Tax=Photobacterium swingsii TaxID=680026 RepID=A0A2T3P7S1_9GAMM|nr:EAL domain-containing protein [Photobacterium swingsii]